ncbi:MAG: hypothetical protein ACRC0E_01190 [Soonwooa sp.]
MKYIKIFFIIVALFSAQVIFAQEEVKKPDEVFGLYFRALMNMNDDAIAELNDYLRPTSKGSDVYGNLSKKAVVEEVKSSTDMFIGANFSKDISESVKASVGEFFLAMFQNLWDSSYKIKEVKLVENPFIKGEKIAEVYYTFSFKKPNISLQESLNAYQNKATTSLTDKDVNDIFKTLTEAYRTKAVEVKVDQKVNLYQRKFDCKLYYIGDNISKTMSRTLKDIYLGH